MKVAITGAAGRIGYNILFRILNREFLETNSAEKLDIACIDIDLAMGEMSKIVEELKDCNYPSLGTITKTSDFTEGFKDADLVILISSALKKAGMPRSSLLQANAKIFQNIGTCLNAEFLAQQKVGKENLKILVVANPANTNCQLANHFASSIPSSNFASLSRLDFQRACIQFSLKTKIPLHRITDLIVLGNHSPSQVPICSHAKIDGVLSKLLSPIFTNKDFTTWANSEFRETVRYRNNNIEKYSGYSSVCSAATATVRQAKEMVSGKRLRDSHYKSWTVMGVHSDSVFGMDEDVYVSLPVYLNGKNEDMEIAKEILNDMNELTKKEVEVSLKELIEEKRLALGEVGSK